MQIPSPVLQLPATSVELQNLSLRSGQRLEALVTRGAASGQPVQVRVSGIALELRLPLDVVQGSRLTLRVIETGPRTAVQLLQHTPVAAGLPAGPVRTPPISAWLGNLLPAQGGQAPLFAQLAALAQQPHPALPHDVQTAMKQVLNALPTPVQVASPEGLRDAVQRSGLFHETTLAAMAGGLHPAGRPVASLKSVLLSLATRLRASSPTRGTGVPAPSPHPPPPRPGAHPVAQARTVAEGQTAGLQPMLDLLRGRVEQAVARLVLHQWSSSENTESGLPRWLLELPLRNGTSVDIVHLGLKGERERSGKEREPVWSAEIALDAPGLGPLHARIAVAGNSVSVQFWLDESGHVERFQSELHRLGAALREHGLGVRDLGCFPGPPPQTGKPNSARTVLDDHA